MFSSKDRVQKIYSYKTLYENGCFVLQSVIKYYSSPAFISKFINLKNHTGLIIFSDQTLFMRPLMFDCT